MLLNQARLKQVLHYNRATGVFTWKARDPSEFKEARRCAAWNGKHAGKVAGCNSANSDGYVRIRIDRKLYLAHVLAWLYVHGRFPFPYLDHKDFDRANNRLRNLREATIFQNNQNVRLKRSNTTGLKGIERSGSKWVARIRAHGERRYLGVFDTAEEAHAAYCEAAKELHGAFANHGRGRA